MTKIKTVRTTPLLGIRPGRFAQFSGWYGMVALLAAYFLASFSLIKGDGLIYQILNLTGGIGLLIVAASKGVLQSVILNFFWAGIGIIAIVKTLITLL